MHYRRLYAKPLYQVNCQQRSQKHIGTNEENASVIRDFTIEHYCTSLQNHCFLPEIAIGYLKIRL